MILRILIALVFSCAPVLAFADIFKDLAGVYGNWPKTTETCDYNPQHLVFTQNSTRGELWVYSRYLTDPTNPDRLLAEIPYFSVLRRTSRGIVIELEDAASRTPGSALNQWEFRLMEDPKGFCWHRVDWPDQRCDIVFERCDEIALTS